jgi:hypothetical protein
MPGRLPAAVPAIEESQSTKARARMRLRVRICSLRSDGAIGHVVAGPITIRCFQMYASSGKNGFVATENCFVVFSWTTHERLPGHGGISETS